jgi:hypothetical protein
LERSSVLRSQPPTPPRLHTRSERARLWLEGDLWRNRDRQRLSEHHSEGLQAVQTTRQQSTNIIFVDSSMVIDSKDYSELDQEQQMKRSSLEVTDTVELRGAAGQVGSLSITSIGAGPEVKT